MNRPIQKTVHILQKVEALVLSASILGIAALSIANVLARNLLGLSLAVAEEVSQFLIILVTFVGLSYAAGLGRHIRMTAVTDQLTAATRRRLERVVRALTALLLLVYFVYACRYVYAVFQLGGVYPVTRTPFFVIYLAAPIGFALGALKYGLLSLTDPPASGPSDSDDYRGIGG